VNAGAEPRANVAPLVDAASLLSARTVAARHGLPCPTVAEILLATGVGRSRAYDLAAKIPTVVAELVRPPGRPRARTAEPAPPATAGLSREVIDYLMTHPGSVTSRGQRHSYGPGFRCFILELIEAHAELDLTVIAAAVGVPLPTLRDWLRDGRPEPATTAQEQKAQGTRADQAVARARLETVLHEWKQWQGGFVPFCNHVRENLRIPWGRTAITSILELHGVRAPRRRPGRSPDEEALRESFETYFPGA